jgi:localization factor PodJL
MAKAPQWNVKGVDEPTRAVARDAAAAAGMPIGTWIDRAVLRAAATQQPAALPPEPNPTFAPAEPSLIERVVGRYPAETAIPAEETLAVGPAPDLAPDDVPRSGAASGIGRGARIAAAIAILAVLTGGTIWFLNERPQTPGGPADRDSSAVTAGTAVSDPEAQPGAAPTAEAAASVAESGALDMLRRAAQDGDARAQYDLGVRFATGRDVPKDDTQAARWFERAAVQGMAAAQYNLGVMYDRGLGLSEDPSLAFFWYQSAAEQGHARAQHNLATAYADGRGTNQDLASAARWFERAAAAGIPDSQYYLGALYERGMGVAPDLSKALGLYRLAAGQGHREAAERVAALAATPAASSTTPVPKVEEFTTGDEAAMPRAAVAEIQRLLSRLDFDPGPADGVIGKKTRDAIARYQAMAGVNADGKPTASLLEELREVAGAAKR